MHWMAEILLPVSQPLLSRTPTEDPKTPMKNVPPRIRKEYGIDELTSCLRSLGAEVRNYRENQGLSQLDFARRAAVSKTTVSDLENEVATDLQLSTFLLICKELGRPPTAFLTASDVELEAGDLRGFLKAIETLKRVSAELQTLYRKIR